MSLLTVRPHGSTFSIGHGSGLSQLFDQDERSSPLVYTFIGNVTKRRVLQHLFRSDHFSSVSLDQGFYINVDSLRATQSQDLILDIDTSIKFADHLDKSASQITLAQPVKTSQELWCLLVAQLILPFTDVLVIFTDDFEGIDNVVRTLKAWGSYGHDISDRPQELRPSLFLVDEYDEDNTAVHVLHEEIFQSFVASDNRLFANSSTVCLDQSSTSGQRSVQTLLSLIGKQQRLHRNLRQLHGWLFNFRHLRFFFEQALCRLAAFPLPALSFVKLCCFGRSVGNMKAFLKQVISELSQSKAPSQVLSQLVASFMMKDYYAPRAHAFPTQHVFDSLYREEYYAVLSQFYDEKFAQIISKDTCKRLSSLQRRHPDLLAKDIFERNLKPIYSWTRLLRLDHFCVGCPHRRPDQVLTCNHRICNDCLKIHGKESLEHENTFHVPRCPLCGAGSITKRLKPSTAGYTILSIDGGGTRGIIPLEFLNILQSGLGTSCPVQYLFDLVAGTSSGGLIALTVFLMAKSVKESTAMFVDMTRKVFKTTGGSMDKMLKLFRALTKDAAYDVIDLESCLKQIFTDGKRMFDHEATSVHAKVFVTASNISTGEPFIFANYNSQDPRKKGNGYKHMRAIKSEDEPKLWEIGRATTAAPFFFNSINIPTLGTFQDGGLQQNNPVSLALWEAGLLWPNAGHPDFVLSLGTGTDMTGDIRAPFKRSIIFDSAIFRCLRSWKTELDGQKRWKEFSNYSQSARRVQRLNLKLPSSQLTLDKADAIEHLQKTLYASYSVKHCESIAASLLFSRLYFHLLCLPVQTAHGQYLCSGQICSELAPSRLIPALQRITEGDDKNVVFRIGQHTISSMVDWTNGICVTCNRFRVGVQFLISELESSFTISTEAKGSTYNLGAFPKTMAWFIQQEGLKSPMGTDSHDSPGKIQCPKCEPEARPKRKDQGLSEAANKRARVL